MNARCRDWEERILVAPSEAFQDVIDNVNRAPMCDHCHILRDLTDNHLLAECFKGSTDSLKVLPGTLTTGIRFVHLQ